MKFRALFLIVSLFGVLSTTKAQIETEIKSYVDTTELIVNNGRKLLLQKINEKEYLKAQEIYQYLKTVTSKSSYTALAYTEQLYINLLTNDWQQLFVLMKNIKTFPNKETFPNSYPIWNVLYEKVVAQADSIKKSMKESDLADEDKAIMDMYLHLLTTQDTENEYKKKLTEFQKTYTPSAYDGFISNYLPRPIANAAIAFSLGSGTIMPTGRIATDFKPGASFNASMDINIGHVYSSLSISGSNFKLKRAFDAELNGESVSFQANDRFFFLNAGLKGGYFIVRNEKFHLAPFTSISGISLESTLFKNEKDGDEYEVFNSFGCGFGLHTEIKLFDFKYSNPYAPRQNSYVSLKLDSGYNFITSHRHHYNGNAPDISLALVWGVGIF